MSRFTPEQVQNALDQTTGQDSQDDRAKAVRAINLFKKSQPTLECDESTIRLYLALRRLNPAGRINAAHLMSHKSVEASSSIKANYWLVQKGRFVLSPDLQKYVVDPSTLGDLPETIDPETVYVFDQAVGRERLGVGVFEFSSSLRVSRAVQSAGSVPALPPANTPSTAAATPSAGDQSASVASGSHPTTSPTEAEQPLPKRQRVLQETVTDPDEVTFEKIAKATKEAFEAKRFSSDDKTSAAFAEFWMAGFVKFMRGSQASASVPSYAVSYVNFCVRQLLCSECMRELGAFGPHFLALKDIREELCPPLARAIVNLSECIQDITKQVSFDNLSLSQQHVFYDSKLYREYMSLRVQSRIDAVKVDHTASNRIHVVQDLLKHDLKEDQRQELVFAQTLLTPMSKEEQVACVLENPIHMQWLTAWFGEEDERVALKPLVTGDLQGLDMRKFMLGVNVASACPDAIKNPGVKALAKDLGKLRTILADFPQLSDELFGELSNLKLGIAHVPKKCDFSDVEEAAINTHLKPLEKIIFSYVRKIGDAAATYPLTSQLLSKFKEHSPKIDEAKPTKEEENKKSDVAATQAQQPSEEGDKAPDGDDEIAAGDEVVLSVTKYKDDFHQKKAECIRVLTKHYVVKMLEGPKKFEEKKILKESCKKVKKASDDQDAVGDNPQTAAKASEVDAQTAANNKLAAALFD